MEVTDEIVKNKLAEWRRKKRLSQAELAKSIGMSQAWVSQAQKSTAFSEIQTLIKAIIDVYPETTVGDLVERRAFLPQAEADLLEMKLKLLLDDLVREREYSRLLLMKNQQLLYKLKFIENTIAKVYPNKNDFNQSTCRERLKMFEEVFDKIKVMIEIVLE